MYIPDLLAALIVSMTSLSPMRKLASFLKTNSSWPLIVDMSVHQAHNTHFHLLLKINVTLNLFAVVLILTSSTKYRILTYILSLQSKRRLSYNCIERITLSHRSRIRLSDFSFKNS